MGLENPAGRTTGKRYFDYSPMYIEFDSQSGRVASIMTHSHDIYLEYNNPNGRVATDSKFYIFMGDNAKNKEGILKRNILGNTMDNYFLFEAN